MLYTFFYMIYYNPELNRIRKYHLCMVFGPMMFSFMFVFIDVNKSCFLNSVFIFHYHSEAMIL